VPISVANDQPPFDFERAFEVPGVADEQIEITLAAALPGGDRLGGVHTFLLERSELANRSHPVLVVEGSMGSWRRGSVLLRDGYSGAKLREAELHVP
jgi:hypothetical protein